MDERLDTRLDERIEYIKYVTLLSSESITCSNRPYFVWSRQKSPKRNRKFIHFPRLSKEGTLLKKDTD